MPDIHWHVGEGAEQETIAKSTTSRRSRRKWIALLLVVILGVGLGTLYRSLPEPAPRPVPSPTILPSPTPSAMPAALYQTIAREAEALADGDRVTLDSIVDIPNFKRYQALMDNLAAWGKPTDSALYSILDYRQLADNKAWVEVRQFRVDRFVQEVRFYQLRDGKWRRTDFDASFRNAFWSGRQETSDTPHFRFTYFVEDHDLIEPLASLLEADYEQICADLACPTTTETCIKALGRQWCSSFPHEITVKFNMNGQIDQERFDFAENGDLTFTMPSLRMLDQFTSSDREDYLRNPTAWLHVARLAYGKTTLSDLDLPSKGRVLVVAIFFREYDRVLKGTGSGPLAMPDEFKQLDTQNLPTLDAVWDTPIGGANVSQIYATAISIVKYIDQEFGWQAVARLLKAIGPSKSLAEAIETSIGQPYAEFEKDWRAWVKVNFTTHK